MDGTQRQKLHSALMDAFPDVKALEQMVSFQLDLSLSSVTATKDLSEATFELIKWANAQGRISDLVEGAYKQNIGNPKLREFYIQDWHQLKSGADFQALNIQQQARHDPIRNPDIIAKNADKLAETRFSLRLTSKTSIIEKKAEEFRINIADPEGLGRLRVCKRMLEGLYGQLDDSHIKVIVVIDMIEKELLAIRKEFDSMKRASKSVVFIQNRYVVSFDKIAEHVRTAYTCIVAVSSSGNIYRNGEEIDINVYKYISQSLMECQDAIYNALQEFVIN